MPSKTEMVNGALRNLGAGRVTNVDTDNTPKSQTVLDVYDTTLKALLRCHNWNFATKRVKLNQSSTTPAFEYDYAYPLPSDWIRTISVSDNDAGHGTIDYRMEKVGTQRCIVTSVSEVYLRYVFYETDGNKYADDFAETFEFALARDLAIAITGSRSLRADMKEEFKNALAQAKSTDSLGQFPERRPRGTWVGARGGYRNDDFLND